MGAFIEAVPYIVFFLFAPAVRVNAIKPVVLRQGQIKGAH
jgi:hypothetical protein